MNKKKWIITAAIAAVVVIVVIVCFLCCGRKNENYCSAVPKDAKVLARIDGASFMNKHNIDLSGLSTLMGGGLDLIKNCGIDFERPFYVFVTQKDASGIVFPVTDYKKLKTSLDLYGDMLSLKVSEKQGYGWVEMSDLVGCFDDSRLVLLTGAGMNSRKILVSLMEQSEEESVMSTSLFENVMQLNKPYAMVVPFSEVLKNSTALAGSSFNLKPEDMDADMAITFDIEGSEAILAFDLVANSDALKNYMKESSQWMSKIQGDFLNEGAENPLVWGSINFNGAKLSSQIIDALGADMMKMMPGLDKAIASINGDLTFTFSDNKLLFQTRVSDKSLLSLLTNPQLMATGKTNAVKIGEDSYCISDGTEPIFAAIKEGTFYLSNSTEMGALIGKKTETALSDKKEEIQNSLVYISCDMQQVLAMAMKSSNEVRSLMTLFAKRLSALDRLTLRCKEPTHFELVLNVKDGADFIETMFK